MATVMAQHANIKLEPGLVLDQTTRTGLSLNDSASPSPSNSELFDRQSTEVSGGERQWLRHGSLESGASTGLTSMCSSVAQDDSADHLSNPSPSKRRKISTSPKTGITSTIRNKQLASKPSTPSSKPAQLRHSQTLKRAGSQTSPKLRARSSIPTSLSVSDFASQCIEAAAASRLDPYSLHRGEHNLLATAITAAEVTVYLNIRNAMLRLWRRNPLCWVTAEEAAGCAKDARFFGLAEVAYQWLSRNGYINFGCVDAGNAARQSGRSRKAFKQRTVVIIGAGVSGLTTARQLENHFLENESDWESKGERPPKVIVIEGRQRIGGRVYSKPLRSQTHEKIPGELRNTAEMGAMIVTGFERGNPLDTIIRGQLGLHYHMLRDALTIYDCDGKPVKHTKDMLNTDLYTDITDRTGEFRLPARPHDDTLKGDEELINRCRDPNPHIPAVQLEPLPDDYDPLKQRKPVSKRGRRTNAPPGTEKLTSRSQITEGGTKSASAVKVAQGMGWRARDGVIASETVSLRDLDDVHQTKSLGRVMDAAIVQYQRLLEVDAQDMRLLNWHHANLEYANAAPVSLLSLSGHDQDNGNEFEGAHSEVVGGYTQVPRGLMTIPTQLDVRFGHTVQSIQYSSQGKPGPAKVTCTNGQTIEADQVVITAPLGVLKSDMIEFNPPLPDWKRGAIDHMGFGLLNKVILVYDEPFWDESRDMFGLLNEAEHKDSLDPRHYERRRGRFYLIWNASKISGRPMLIALMAGHAAYEAETTDTPTLLSEVTARLKGIYKKNIPLPREVIVTRWRQDPFSRGTYSFIAPWTQPGDYDLMAKGIGNLHFAGEATCGTHPATVHGALLSGLRAASDVLDVMSGPIELPSPLVEAVSVKAEAITGALVDQTLLRPEPAVDDKAATKPVEITKFYYGKKELSGPPQKSVCPEDPSYWVSLSLNSSNSMLEALVQSAIHAKIGDRPLKPSRPGVNPFLIYSREKWEECKASCTKDGKAGQNAVRQVLSQWWKALDESAKKPYVDQSKVAQESADANHKQWKFESEHWDVNAKRIREDFMQARGQDDMARQSEQHQPGGGRKTNVSTNIALDFTALQ